MLKTVFACAIATLLVVCSAQAATFDFHEVLTSKAEKSSMDWADVLNSIASSVDHDCEKLSSNDVITIVTAGGGPVDDGGVCDNPGCTGGSTPNLPTFYGRLKRSGAGQSYTIDVQTEWVSTDEPYLAPAVTLTSSHCKSTR